MAFAEQIMAAANEAWSGHFRGNVAGQIACFGIMDHGRLAWAVAKGQQADVGRLLTSMAKVPAPAVEQARAAYQKSDRKKCFPAVLHETGIAPLPVLRRCLQLHNRAALQTAVTTPDLTVDMHEARVAMDPDILFSLVDLMPQIEPTISATHPWLTLTDHNRVLEPLSTLPSFKAGAIIDATGRVVTALVRANEAPAEVLGAVVAPLAESATRLAAYSALGSVQAIIVTAEQGTFVGKWLDAERTHILAVVIEEQSQIGMATYRLNSLLPAAGAWTASLSN